MLRLAFILSAAVCGFLAYAQNLEKLNTHVYNWNDLTVTKTESGARRQIFEGFTSAFTYFEVHVTTLNRLPCLSAPGQRVHLLSSG